MTNKPMLSVERELLERAASAIEKHHGSLQWVIASDLRALLDNPEDKICSVCNGFGRYQDGDSGTDEDGRCPNIVDCDCGDSERIPEYRAKPAARSQGEPVAYTTAGMLEIAKRLPLTGRIGAKATKDERWNIPLFLGQAEQLAPAAVVMPERMKESKWSGIGRMFEEGLSWGRGYNKALDDVARLNGVNP